jgi:hypothetical protein
VFVKDYVYVPFKLHATHLPNVDDANTIVLSTDTFSPTLCNSLFEVDFGM